MSKMSGGDALISSLEREGVEVIFGLPGVQMYGVVDALRRNNNIKMIVPRHEQAPPKKVKKTKTKTVVSVDQNEKIDSKTPEAIPLPEKTVKKIETKKEKNKETTEIGRASCRERV